MSTTTVQTKADCDVYSDSGQIIKPGATAFLTNGERCTVTHVDDGEGEPVVSVRCEDGSEDNFSATADPRHYRQTGETRSVCWDIERMALRKLPAKLRDPDEISPVKIAANDVMTARAALVRAGALHDRIPGLHRQRHAITTAIVWVDALHEALSDCGRASSVQALPAPDANPIRGGLDALSIASTELGGARIMLRHPDAVGHRELIDGIRSLIRSVADETRTVGGVR